MLTGTSTSTRGGARLRTTGRRDFRPTPTRTPRRQPGAARSSPAVPARA
jgi:hypothetical protein